MFEKTIDWIKMHEKISLFVLVFFFVVLRLPGTSLPLHQDEYKWPLIVNPVNVGGIVPHPPLGEFIFRTGGSIVGYNVHFRFIPLFFATLNLILLFYVLKRRFGKNIAFVGVSLFTLSYFSILASLMVDTDGSILPFFFLLMLLAYDRIEGEPSVTRNLWISLLLCASIFGLFVKVSFVLVIGSLFADFLWQRRKFLDRRMVVKYSSYVGIFCVAGVTLLIVSQKLFPFFNLNTSITYWKHFAVGNRNLFQTVIQVVKALLYMSPFFIVTPFFLAKERVKELIPFFSYLIFGFIFYIILFDFSLGALDRYLQFIVIPLCVLSAVAIVDTFSHQNMRPTKAYLFIGTALAGILCAIQFITHSVPSLYPKTEWIGRLTSLHWNFLYPFSGGSGPIGFYVSFLFMGLVWAISFFVLGIGFFKKQYRTNILLVLIPLGLMYNGVFAEEYMFGRINGSSSKLVAESVEFIKNNPAISKVIVYNDNGGAEVQQIGKYERRMYAVPQFESTYKEILPSFTGHILFINIPRVDPQSYYGKYMSSCTPVYSNTDRYITAQILDCSHTK